MVSWISSALRLLLNGTVNGAVVKRQVIERSETEWTEKIKKDQARKFFLLKAQKNYIIPFIIYLSLNLSRQS